MNEKDKLILKKLFILLDYARKLCRLIANGKRLEGFNGDHEFASTMFDKVQELKIKLSFKYKNKDEVALRYIASKSRLIWKLSVINVKAMAILQ